MRRMLELFTHRVLRTRVGLALLLTAIILGVVGTAKVLGGPDSDGGALTPQPTVGAQTGDPRAGDDGVDSPEPVPNPRTSPGTAAPLAVAHAFAQAWLDHDGVSASEWYGGLLPHSTERVATLLEGVDPAEVPADRITGEMVLTPRSEEFIEVAVPVDSGVLRLQLISIDGRWLVDSVDWERG